MNVLLTGSFGNIGRSTLGELVGAGHRVRCFDLPTRSNLKGYAGALRRGVAAENSVPPAGDGSGMLAQAVLMAIFC